MCKLLSNTSFCNGIIILITFSFFFIIISTVSEATKLVPTTTTSIPVSGFVTTNNTQFLLNNSPFLFNGFNSYWMMNVATDPTQRYKISNVFRDASAVGLTVCRTWAFADGGDTALQISPGVYDERVFQVPIYKQYLSIILFSITIFHVLYTKKHAGVTDLGATAAPKG